MKKFILLLLIFCYGISQTNCELCVEQNGFYCGDDESNWTQYSPLGCVPNGLNDLYYLNDGWSDCIDNSDENETTPTTIEDCNLYNVDCDTVYVDVFITDTIYINTIDSIVNIEYSSRGCIEFLELSLFFIFHGFHGAFQHVIFVFGLENSIAITF